MRVAFAEFVLDRGARQLSRAGEVRHLGPKAFDLLDLLLRHRPNVVPKERIRDCLWPGTFVADSTLATLVAEVRSALDEDPKAPRFLRTVHGVGYAFFGPVAEDAARAPRPAASRAYRLVFQDREVALVPGENVLGRVEDGVLWIESPTVSRRHARIVVEGSQALLEDLGSKNGTFVDGRRISSPTPLSHGDSIGLGRQVVLKVLTVRPAEVTKTAEE